MAKKPMFLIALGGNLPTWAGPPEATLAAAIAALRREGVTVGAVSRLYRTPCFPAGAGPDYVNAAAQITAEVTARELLEILHRVEAQFDRERTHRWGMRTLDLDLLAAGAQVLPDVATYSHWRDLPMARQHKEAPDQLILPHPRLQDRAFVLVPLRDIAPDWRHPVSGATVTEMCDTLPKAERAAVVAL